ncbi:MAG: hypothetical protein K2Q20_01540, partial [Phycisphaerales bacterium]|nr:hypothetical protein [Phycisphaerales bacterium]
SPAEEDQINQMIRSGNESEARRLLFERFSATAEAQANAARGPWSRAWDDLTESFHRFTTMISNSAPFRALNGFLNTIGENIRQRISDLTYFFNYASQRGFFGAVGDAINGRAAPGTATANAQNQAAAFANRGGRVEFGAGGAGGVNVADTLAGERATRRLRDELDRTRRSTDRLSQSRTAYAASVRAEALANAVGSDAQRRQQADLATQAALVQYDDARSKRDARNARAGAARERRDARAAETLANQRRAIEESLVRDLDGLESQVGRNQVQSIEQRRQAIMDQYTRLFQQIDEARRKGVTSIGGQSLAEYERVVRAQITILQNAAEQQARETQITDTIKQRGDEIKNVQDQLERGDLTPSEALVRYQEIVSRFAPQITQMATDALTFARNLRTAVPNPQLEAYIARLERIQQQNSGGQDHVLLRTLDQGVITSEGRKLEELQQQREAYVQAENNLVQLGLRSRTEAQTNIEAVYARTNPLIAEQIARMRELLGTFVAANPEMQTFYDTWIAKLDGVAAQSQYVDARFTQLKSGFDNLISQNAVDAIDNIAKSFANLALGQQNAVDTLLQIGAA